MDGGVTIEVRRFGGGWERRTRVPCTHARLIAAAGLLAHAGGQLRVGAVEACEGCGAVLGPVHAALLSPVVRA